MRGTAQSYVPLGAHSVGNKQKGPHSMPRYWPRHSFSFCAFLDTQVSLALTPVRNWITVVLRRITVVLHHFFLRVFHSVSASEPLQSVEMTLWWPPSPRRSPPLPRRSPPSPRRSQPSPRRLPLSPRRSPPSPSFFESKCIFPKCNYPKCIFAKCTRLACLLSLRVYLSWK